MNTLKDTLDIQDTINSITAKLSLVAGFAAALSQTNEMDTQISTGIYTVLDECIYTLETINKVL